jgi:hypothetical protein
MTQTCPHGTRPGAGCLLCAAESGEQLSIASASMPTGVTRIKRLVYGKQTDQRCGTCKSPSNLSQIETEPTKLCEVTELIAPNLGKESGMLACPKCGLLYLDLRM